MVAVTPQLTSSSNPNQEASFLGRMDQLASSPNLNQEASFLGRIEKIMISLQENQLRHQEHLEKLLQGKAAEASPPEWFMRYIMKN